MKKQPFPILYIRSLARTEAALAAYADTVLTREPGVKLRFSQYLILSALAHGAVTQADVARKLSISGAATSRHMSILHTKGYVTRYIKEDEKRAHEVALTKRGAAERRLAEQVLVKAFQEPLHGISASARTSVLRTLEKTVHGLKLT